MKNLVILGNFDGVHLGHKNLIEKAIEYAKENNLKTILYTFKTLPKDKKYLTTIEEKKQLILSLGVDEVVLDDFSQIRKLTPIEFVNKILKEKLEASIVFCGYNYSFGYMREGSPSILKKLIATVVVDEFRLDNKLVSSSKIRQLIQESKIEEVNKLLSSNFKYTGIVVKGRQLGRIIGFPTANIKKSENKIAVLNGVYGSYTKIEGYDKKYLSITNVGKNPTISSDNELNIETHILDFHDDIYGKKIQVDLVHMLRAEIKFKTVQELKEQILKDTIMWREMNVRN